MKVDAGEAEVVEGQPRKAFEALVGLELAGLHGRQQLEQLGGQAGRDQGCVADPARVVHDPPSPRGIEAQDGRQVSSVPIIGAG